MLQSVFIPFTGPHEFVGEYKQSHKRDDDLAVGNAAFRVVLEPAASGATLLAACKPPCVCAMGIGFGPACCPWLALCYSSSSQ